MDTEKEIRARKLIVRTRIMAEIHHYLGDRGSTVVKVLCYKSEGRWFNPSWCKWIFR